MYLLRFNKSLHLHDEPRIAATQVEEVRVNLQIDLHTGCIIDPTPHATAAYQAVGPDRPDPPSECGRSPGGGGGGGGEEGGEGGWPGAPGLGAGAPPFPLPGANGKMHGDPP